MTNSSYGRSRVLARFAGIKLVVLAVLFVIAPNASALPANFLGLHWGGGHGPADIEMVARSGAKYFHYQLSQTTGLTERDQVFEEAW